MRDKEAIENERKNLLRNLEKQEKVVENVMAAEKSMRLQLVRRATYLLGFFTETLLERTRPVCPRDARSDRHSRCEFAKAHDREAGTRTAPQGGAKEG